MFLTCGIPSLALLGEKADWEDFMGRLDKLPRLGEEPTQWTALLRPVLTRFVATFDNPEDREVNDFWITIPIPAHGASISDFGTAAYW
ncbi:uncharacterized protein MKZ38_008129 [Zalerion maritima]|uniref:Uncharacterized protein n=1 Tax=Zalerion maritima TaxID=339359 RepID=A0AAD5RH26_9PEZI|nr:uncharacterized protein MKZ38_008129 [Zalerion maritima]